MKNGVSLDLDDFFKDNDLSSYDPIDKIWKVKEYVEFYDVDLTIFIDTYNIYIVYFRSTNMDDV